MIDPIEQSLNRYLKEQDRLDAYEIALEKEQEKIYDMTVWQLIKLLDREIDRETLALRVSEEADRQVQAACDDPDEYEVEMKEGKEKLV